MEMPPYHPPKKYSVRIDGHRTSISLEPLFWDKLTTAARMHNVNTTTGSWGASAATGEGIAVTG